MSRTSFVALISICIALSSVPPALAQSGTPQDFRPRQRPELEVSRAAGEIDIDGELEDAGWRGVAKATGFTEFFPDENARPAVSSEAWVTYDEDNLYLAFVAEDDPATVRTSIADRDEIFADDIFGIMLDTYGDASWAYEILANPSGVQGDLRMAGNGEDPGFDILFESAGKVTDRGYQVELAIPFESLRFPDRAEQVWRATFIRIRPRASREQYSWAALERDEECFMCQFGTITGIQGVEPGGSLELLPAAVASQAAALDDPGSADAGLENDGLEAEASLGMRYAHPSGITAEGTINPDFSQVESDVAQIDVNTTFALFFPERRPFFQEGSELFDTYFDVVYTRQINDPDVAAKTIGRLGRTSFAYLGARDANSPVLLPFKERSFVAPAEESITNIGRFRRSYSEGSYVGAMVTDRRFESGGGSGTTYGIDGLHRLGEKYRLEYQFLGSHTAEPDEAGITARLGDATFDDGSHTAVFDGESFGGFAQYTSFERSARHWNFDIDYWASSPTFRSDVGFEFRNDFRRVIVFNEYNVFPESISWLDQVTPDFRYRRSWDYGGTKELELFQPTLELTLKGQTFAEVGWEREYERFRDVEFDDMRRWFVFARSQFSDPVTLGIFVSNGDRIARNVTDPFVGEGTDMHVFATLKPNDLLSIDPSVRFSRLESPDGEELFSGYVLRTRATYNFSRKLFLRFVVQWDDFGEELDVEPLLTYKINPFTLFFVGSSQTFERFDEHRDGDLTQSERQFFAKFQYLFRM